MPPEYVTAVVPAFDAEATLAATLDAILSQRGTGFTLAACVVVDDGSRDESAGRIAEARALHPEIRAVHHPSNRGYGAALRSGLREARGELVFFSDADLQFDLGQLAALLAHTHEFDVVAGYREPRRDPWPRLALAATWGALVRGLFGLRVRDIDCAMKLFRREVFDGLRLDADGPFLSAELLIKLKARGERMTQVGVTHYPRTAGENTGASFRKILRTFRDLATLRWALWTDRQRVLGSGKERVS